MLRLAAAGGAGLILSSAATSQVVPGLVVPSSAGTGAAGPAPAPLVPAQPIATPSAPAGIDPQLFAKAKAAMATHRVWPNDAIGIVDFSKPSSEPRFHIVDLASGSVDSHLVAHGRGSDPSHSGFL
ncbi:MAG TPA: murein L,D-transpeptidase catalytic domain family protein, partial [Sphingomicrobium sp.]|nr:murein L,D-transpeptidase catalytic domain family protein [Sphingomicrobium sp.]